MSTTVISQGFIAVLSNRIIKDLIEDVSEELHDYSKGLDINYDGTLLVFDSYATKSYSEREFNGDLFIIGELDDSKRDSFIAIASAAGFDVDPETVKPYTCVWYNSSDSPVNMLTKEGFLGLKAD